MNIAKRLAGFLAGMTLAGGVMAQAWPTKPISLLIPFPPGTGNDIIGRVLGTEMSKILGQTVVPDNRAGVSGNIAMEATSKAAPDGYTIFLPTASILTVNPHQYKNVQYDPHVDFVTIGQIVNTSNLFVVKADSNIRSFKDLVDAARARPDAVSYGSSGAGSVQHLAGEALLKAMMGINPGPHVLLEVPAFMAADPAHTAALQGLHAGGTPLMLKGRPQQPLLPEVLACFSHSVVDINDERRTGVGQAAAQRRITTVQDGIRSSADVKAAFEHGAVAVMGWQFDDPPPGASARGKVPPDIQVVMELVGAVDREEHVSKLETILKRDPTVAFRLMRYLNSPAFGLSVEINSFGHALMLLGYARLKRWLALLLASSTKDANAKPLMFAALRRGLLLEELVRHQGDAEMRSEIFICGVFSLLDRLLNQPFGELLASVPVPERVRQALAEDDGPFHPYMELVRAIESSAVFDIRECSERLLLGPAEVNRALLLALAGARQLD